MIKSFTVENFISIKDKMTISFDKSSLTDETYYENSFICGQKSYLKAIAIYGANASGKTNIIKAFANLQSLVKQNNPISFLYSPFLLSKETIDKPTSFSIEFVCHNDIDLSLRYSISYNRNVIIEEKLEQLTSQKYSLIYIRNYIDEHNFSLSFGQIVNDNALLNALKSSLIPSRPFLSLFGQFSIPVLSDAFTFFNNELLNITPEVSRHLDYNPTTLENNKDFLEFSIKLLKASDINVSDIKFEKISKVNYLTGQTQDVDSLLLKHSGEEASGYIPFFNESLGTKKILLLAEFLYPALSKPSILIIDELESSLHPELTKLIVTCFLDETVNRYNSQLIFTSHETSLLDLDFLRRDQIQFVYKDKSTCGTYIHSLKEFHIRKTDSIEKSYIAGRYDTSPEVDESILAGAKDNEQKTNKA